jgi:hypothetical protein
MWHFSEMASVTSDVRSRGKANMILKRQHFHLRPEPDLGGRWLTSRASLSEALAYTWRRR